LRSSPLAAVGRFSIVVVPFGARQPDVRGVLCFTQMMPIHPLHCVEVLEMHQLRIIALGVCSRLIIGSLAADL
jgi:hypothetical protein